MTVESADFDLLKARLLANRAAFWLRAESVLDDQEADRLIQDLQELAGAWRTSVLVDKDLAGWLLTTCLMVAGSVEGLARSGAGDLLDRAGDFLGRLYTALEECFGSESDAREFDHPTVPVEHAHLQGAVDVLARAFHAGIPPADYLPLLVALEDDFSARGLAIVVAALSGRDRFVVENDAASTTSINPQPPDEVRRVRALIEAAGWRSEH